VEKKMLTPIVRHLLRLVSDRGTLRFTEVSGSESEKHRHDPQTAQALNTAFLVCLAGDRHRDYARADNFLCQMAHSPRWSTTTAFYRSGIERIQQEIDDACRQKDDFALRLKTLRDEVDRWENLPPAGVSPDRFWSVFFPEGSGIFEDPASRVAALRAKRRVSVTALNAHPIADPALEILFTSNILLTVPPDGRSSEHLPHEMRRKIDRIVTEPQRYWYDHPIPLGVAPQNNEVLYGLRGLDKALRFERRRGNASNRQNLTCLLSISVTHDGLHDIGQAYIADELARAGGFPNLNVFLVTELATRKIIDEILAPAAGRYLGRHDPQELLTVFGVDGEYGRHYSFLKAMAAFWQIFIDPQIRATFKIDLDQVFPQPELAEQANGSAFELFQTPLWGALGTDADGKPLELGMIAGALVNESDIHSCLFAPDVRYPDRPLSPDEYIFFSQLPQALSTEAEMMARYGTDDLDGHANCLQRIHVTGGTNGILVEALRRHRPFTPSFIGRAEDQAYILSTLTGRNPRLAYLHRAGLIMRHDKEAFAADAIQASSVGRLIGDYIRLLYFTAYAAELSDDLSGIKAGLDPFTGCFISRIPITVTYLRFGLKAATFFLEGQPLDGVQFIRSGARRIARAIDFIGGTDSELKKRLAEERAGWDLYYDTLARVQQALDSQASFASALKKRAQNIIKTCKVS
jgi:hypothetical protein